MSQENFVTAFNDKHKEECKARLKLVADLKEAQEKATDLADRIKLIDDKLDKLMKEEAEIQGIPLPKLEEAKEGKEKTTRTRLTTSQIDSVLAVMGKDMILTADVKKESGLDDDVATKVLTKLKNEKLAATNGVIGKAAAATGKLKLTPEGLKVKASGYQVYAAAQKKD